MDNKENHNKPADNGKQSHNGHLTPDESMICRLSDSGKWIALVEKCEFSVEKITKELCVSRRHFRRIATGVFGSAPEELLTDWRLVVSKKALKERGRVKDAAVFLGYKQPAL